MIKLNQNQSNAWHYLTNYSDNEVREVLYGGFAGGGKSFLGSLWLDYMCRSYAGTRWLMGREQLKNLKATTLNTYFEVLQKQGIPASYIKYNQQSGIITYPNGSEIILAELSYKPSDPLVSALGGLELTGAFIDEAPEVRNKVIDTLSKSRIRYKLSQYGLKAKILYTCNPTKNWAYKNFYKPHKSGVLMPSRKFIESRAEDNIHLPEGYIAGLNALEDRAQRERLLHGNWDYDLNPARLMEYDPCTDIFTNSHVARGTKYITADIARFGQDKTVIIVWDGLRAVEIETINSSTLTVAAERIKRLATDYAIPMSQVLCDEDGIGGGVVDMLKCKGFTANKTSAKYANIKAECYYLLAEKVNKAEIYIGAQLNNEQTEAIIQELQAIERGNIDKDTKPSISSKESQKQILGRSPDYADALMMRMWFDVGKAKILAFG